MVQLFGTRNHPLYLCLLLLHSLFDPFLDHAIDFVFELLFHLLLELTDLIFDLLVDVQVDAGPKLADEEHLQGECVVVWLQVIKVLLCEIVHIVLVEVLKHLLQVLEKWDSNLLFLCSEHLQANFYFNLI